MHTRTNTHIQTACRGKEGLWMSEGRPERGSSDVRSKRQSLRFAQARGKGTKEVSERKVVIAV